jgi:hypothetical protein
MPSSIKPFGMLFEECAQAPITLTVVPEYDSTESLSFIVDQAGNRIPFISQEWTMAATETLTLIRAEASDSDQEQPVLGTQTATKVQAEGSDDDTPPKALATATETRVKTESGDNDTNGFYFRLGTQTLTEVRAENTDAD